MRDSRQCLNCGSKEIAGPHRLRSADAGHLHIDLPGIRTSTLEAYSCLDCGYTQLFIDEIGLSNIRNLGRIHSSEKDIE